MQELSSYIGIPLAYSSEAIIPSKLNIQDVTQVTGIGRTVPETSTRCVKMDVKYSNVLQLS